MPNFGCGTMGMKNLKSLSMLPNYTTQNRVCNKKSGKYSSLPALARFLPGNALAFRLPLSYRPTCTTNGLWTNNRFLQAISCTNNTLGTSKDISPLLLES
jgi:hypothetical protein